MPPPGIGKPDLLSVLSASVVKAFETSNTGSLSGLTVYTSILCLEYHACVGDEVALFQRKNGVEIDLLDGRLLQHHMGQRNE